MSLRNEIEGLVTQVEQYDAAHPELASAHHWVFGCPIPREAERFDFVLLGLNPGEQHWNWSSWPKRTSESAKFDWIYELPGAVGQGKAWQWRNLISRFCGDHAVMMSELFFWSSNNASDAFVTRYGTVLEKSSHLRFCTELNLALVQVTRPKAVIVPGVSRDRFFIDAYALERRSARDLLAENGHSLVRAYESGGIPWIFTKHWTGARGFSRIQREALQRYIASIA